MQQDVSDKRTRIRKRILALSLFLLCFLVYSSTLSYRFYGYEHTILDSFRDLVYCRSLSGFTPAGLLDIVSYLPMELVNLVFVSSHNMIARDFVALQTLPLMSALVCLVFYALCLELYGSVKTAVGTTLLFAFFTMLWPYSKMGMEIQHTLWPLVTVWMLARWHKRRRMRDLVLAGICAGFILHTKVYGFVTTGAFMISIAMVSLTDKKNRSERFSQLGHFLVPVAVLFLLFLVQNRLRHGGWFLGTRYNVEYEARRVPIWQPLAGFLFSSGKSIFIYNPLLVLSLFYIPKFFHRNPELKLPFILTFGLGLLFHSLLWIWTDESWGPRKLLYLVPFGMLPLGILLEEFGTFSLWKRALILVTAILAFFVQILGVSFSYETHPVLLREKNLSTLENIRYNPLLSHTAMNHALLRSTLDRYWTGRTHYYIYTPGYLSTVAPVVPPKPVAISLEKFSFFDFWFLEHRAPRLGRLVLSPGVCVYFSLLLVLIPLLLFLIYLLLNKMNPSPVKWSKTASGRLVFLVLVLGIILCDRYNLAYQRDYMAYTIGMPDLYDFAVGDDTRDEEFLGPGFRGSEWMRDRDHPQNDIPFRWTNSYRSFIYFPIKPGNSYKLTLQMIFVFPTRISVWVNQHCVGFEKGRDSERKILTFTIPKEILGSARLCDIMILHQNMHVPALEKPGSQDRSTLGIMVYGVRWEKIP